MPSADDLTYDQLQTLGRPGVWRPFVGVVGLFVGVWFLLAILVIGIVTPDNLNGQPVTPRYLAATNLWWALTIPTVCLVTWLVHRLSPRWLFSVVACFRWRWFAACLALAVLTLVATVVVSSVLPSQGEATADFSGHLNPWTSQVRDFVLVIALLTPLQAAGEEFLFRGYLTQAVGNLVSHRSERVRTVLVVVVPAFLFGLAHGIGQDVPTFFDRFAFGIVAGVLVLVTGGIEAGIAMHVLNNFLAFGLALAYSDMTTALHVTHGSWWAIPVTLTQSLLYLALCWWLSGKVGLKSRSGEGILATREAAL
ncbi:MAG TPA: CPBP family intramembrane glutamic endopeptidase [Nocardioides sp.]|nr:CPBP family intramembrane glutamic endopeptidase [Nocardioides sp.]